MQEHREIGYMGDGVYLSHDGYQHWLAVGHHLNRVVALEPGVAETVCMAILSDTYGDDLSTFLKSRAETKKSFDVEEFGA